MTPFRVSVKKGSSDALVHEPALGGERIFLPLPLDVDQRPLPAAKQEMLDARERQQIVLGVFGGHIVDYVVAKRAEPDEAISSLP